MVSYHKLNVMDMQLGESAAIAIRCLPSYYPFFIYLVINDPP